MRCQGCSSPSINAWPRMLGDAVGCVMVRAEVGPLDVQKLKLRAPRAGAVKRAPHKAGCGCTGRHSRSCRRAAALHRHPYGAEAAWATRCQYHDDLHAHSNWPAEACLSARWLGALGGRWGTSACGRAPPLDESTDSTECACCFRQRPLAERSRSARPSHKRVPRESQVQAPMSL
jgi:hypothetical protein